jgi:ribosomal protein S4
MRSYGELASETNFTRTSKTLFQTYWISKKLTRGYHGDWMMEMRFKKGYLPPQLPPIKTPPGQPKVPVGSMLFAELERRLDVAIFRACFAVSVYQAKNLILNGKVKLNGKTVSHLSLTFTPKLL